VKGNNVKESLAAETLNSIIVASVPCCLQPCLFVVKNYKSGKVFSFFLFWTVDIRD
jgi:hypothetical protein